MRQVIIPQAGPPEIMRIIDAPPPDPAPGEVRIKVAAAGVNFADVMGRLGIYPDAPKFPYVPGYEVAGTVDAVGAGVDAVRSGERVIALVRFGGYSEAVCVPAIHVLPLPEGISFEKAAGFPVAFLTAYAGLVALAGIKPGEHVLIHAAAGGVGLAAVDIARIFGATIYGTASGSKHDFLRERGVQHPIDYRRVDFEREIRRLTHSDGVQIALDSIGGRSWLKSYRALSAGGRLVICGISAMAPGPRRSIPALIKTVIGIPWIQFNPIKLTNDNKGISGLNLGHLWSARDQVMVRGWADQLLAWVREGRLDVHVDRVFPLEDAAQAHRRLQDRQNIGKVILVP